MADLSLDKAMLHGGARKNSLRPLQRRDLVPELMQRFGCSQRNALRIVQMSASTYLYRSVARDATVLTARIKEITETRVHYGYRRVHVLLRREGQGHPLRAGRGFRSILKQIHAKRVSMRLDRPFRMNPQQEFIKLLTCARSTEVVNFTLNVRELGE